MCLGYRFYKHINPLGLKDDHQKILMYNKLIILSMKITIKHSLTKYVCIFLLFSTHAFSQSDSLMHYLEIAARNNPTVLQKLTDYEAALQKVPQVGALSDPELNVGVFLTPMELIGGNQVAEFQLMQMFPWFGVLKNAKDEMSLMAKAKYEQFQDAKLQLFYDVQRTWYELYKIEQDIRISEKNIEVLRMLERLSLVKFKAVTTGNSGGTSSASSAPVSSQPSGSSGSGGMGGMGGNAGSNPSASQSSSSMQSNSMGVTSGGSGLADLYRIQIEIGELDNNIAFLKDQRNTVFARFNSYLNRAAKNPVAIPDSITADSLSVDLLVIPDSILAKNPMLRMSEYEQQSYDARKKMVTRMGAPMVGIGLNYTLINKNEMSTSEMNGEDMIMPMFKVTLPIYRKKYKAMKREAELMKVSAEAGYKASANALQTEYYEALQFHQDATRRMKLYENQSLLAQKSLDIMVKSFSVSGSGLNEVLRVRQQTLDYELRRAQAITDYNTSVAWLKRLMGGFGPSI